MQTFIKKALPDWLLIIAASKAATTVALLTMGYG